MYERFVVPASVDTDGHIAARRKTLRRVLAAAALPVGTYVEYDVSPTAVNDRMITVKKAAAVTAGSLSVCGIVVTASTAAGQEIDIATAESFVYIYVDGSVTAGAAICFASNSSGYGTPFSLATHTNPVRTAIALESRTGAGLVLCYLQ
jgi:hypothetical protein